MSQSFKNRRWRLVADVRIQGELLVRLAVYWCLFQFAQLGTIAVFAFLAGGSGDTGLRFLVPSVVVSFLFLPVVMLDSLRFSNRFVGPFVNLRNRLVKLAQGVDPDPIQFRQNDFLVEVEGAFNTVREKVVEAADWQSVEAEDTTLQSATRQENCHV